MVTFEGDNTGDASLQTLQTVLMLSEVRIYRDARTAYNVAEFGASDVIASGRLAHPSAFKAVSLIHFGDKPLEPVAPEFILEHQTQSPSGQARYFASIGEELIFSPSIADGTQAQGWYFKELPALSESTIASNGLFNAANDLFLYACMVEAAPMYGFMDQIELWEARYQATLGRLNSEYKMHAYSAGRMKRRASTTLMG